MRHWRIEASGMPTIQPTPSVLSLPPTPAEAGGGDLVLGGPDLRALVLAHLATGCPIEDVARVLLEPAGGDPNAVLAELAAAGVPELEAWPKVTDALWGAKREELERIGFVDFDGDGHYLDATRYPMGWGDEQGADWRRERLTLKAEDYTWFAVVEHTDLDGREHYHRVGGADGTLAGALAFLLEDRAIAPQRVDGAEAAGN
jgi:hypothetical protein